MAEYERLAHHLNTFSELVGTFCIGEIPDIGALISALEKLIDEAKKVKPDTFESVARACKNYIENITLEKIDQMKPIEEALVLLKALFQHLKKGQEFIFETKDVMDLLFVSTFKEDKTDESPPVVLKDQPASQPAEPQGKQALEPLSEDDMEILADFVSEGKDNLDLIEVGLVELEQDPTDVELINNIFRPFHTIKGVSGFLSLKKINRLSHATENLLDSARSGDFIINRDATDVILEAVDTLKHLIGRVEDGFLKGVHAKDDDIDTDALTKKLKNLQKAMKSADKQLLGEILMAKGVIDEPTLEQTLAQQKLQPEKKLGEILVQEKKVGEAAISSALRDQKTLKKQVEAQVKVSTQKLDDLVDFAGELVIAQSMLRQQALNTGALAQSIDHLGQIVSKMQAIAMSMRMIPIKATFTKMIRLVRDLSQKSGKAVGLHMSGEDTEIDRNVVEAIYEPMVHMIRNAVDHGIEAKVDRTANGKPEKGSIFLKAYHKGGHIIIEIEDDGKGLDKDKILAKAVRTGLVQKEDKLTDSQIYQLILEPGFSTADQITDVSGRGVGMDVVKDGIEKFRGNLEIESEPGKKTKFTISLPLTLAIIDGMLVRVEAEKYVIPTTAIQKAFKPGKDEVFTVEGKGEMVKDRDQLVPLIRLGRVFGNKNSGVGDIGEKLVLVVESKFERRGLVVDELLGKDEYVIKSLGGNLESVKGIAGGAILSDGKVGLILDIQGIFNIVSSREKG